MNKVNIIIDGENILAEAGKNLLAEALSCGFNIPHLCYDPRLKPFGACRLCFVEVKGHNQPFPACSLTVTEGLEIRTNSEQLRQLRKTALELLMAEHCGDCVAPCTLACPAGVDIQGFIAFIKNDELAQAANLIREKMPLPSICGRVCPRFCEDQCRRSLVDEAVDICDLKRYAGDYWLEKLSEESPVIPQATGFHVAIVGGGPAGLTAAYYLALQGHQVTIYEANQHLGGMLRYGIPEYRLPERILDQEIQVITGLCHEVKLGQVFGQDFSLAELQASYDAVFLGVGCQAGQTSGLAGEELSGVYSGVDFLHQVTLGQSVALGKRVAVIGGGNTAMDAARTAIRLGAEEVVVLYRRTQEEMPAEPLEVIEAMEEGVQFYFLTNIKALIGQERIEQIQCVKMELGAVDSSGRRRPQEVPGSEFIEKVDTVIMAIGQKVEPNLLDDIVATTSWGTVITDQLGATSAAAVFAAGDCVSGAATVVEAVGQGREVAQSIDFYLRGQSLAKLAPVNSSTGSLEEQDLVNYQEFTKQPRLQPKQLVVTERVTNFKEYYFGFTSEEAKQEATRCLECGCIAVHDCTLRDLATEYQIDLGPLGQSKKRYPVDHSHPLIIRDQNKCVLCGKCVLLCEEISANGGIGFVHRGYDTIVGSVPGLPVEDNCYSCGQCVASCPTGALSVKLSWVKPGPWKIERVVETTCLQCNIGCALELKMVGDKIVLAHSPIEHLVSHGALCKKGSFNYQFLYSDHRILNPTINQGNQQQKVSWEQAISFFVDKLTQIKAVDGGSKIAVLASPRLTNEEQYLVQKFARLALGTNNLTSTRPSNHFYQQFGILQEFNSAENLLVFAPDYRSKYPVLGRRIKQAIERGGKQIVVDSFKELVAVMEELGSVSKGVILVDSEVITETETRQLIQLLTASEKFQLKLVLINDDGNGQGQLMMGVHPQLLPGLRSISQLHNQQFFARYYGKSLPVKPGLNREQLLQGFQSGELKGLVVIGDDLDLADSKLHPDVFKVAISANWQDYYNSFDLVLPAATFIESNGTAINLEGRLQKVHQVMEPKGGKENWEILVELINAFGVDYQITGINDLVKEIVSVVDPSNISKNRISQQLLGG